MQNLSSQTLLDDLKGVVQADPGAPRVVLDAGRLREKGIDTLVWQSAFGDSKEVQRLARWIIWQASLELGCPSTSIQELYAARGRGECKGFTTPAINIRALTYDVARTLFRVVNQRRIGPFIFEIARSEMGYTFQRPWEYTASVLAAAIKEGYRGPVFLQGDHFQFNAKKYKEKPADELASIQTLTEEALDAGFFNIDIDSSTLVDLSFPALDEQQRANYENAAILTEFIRKRQPRGVIVSVGGEIGEVGKKNSTVEELRAYMDGYKRTLAKRGAYQGISKISVQTGTSHGGVVLPDGSIAKVALDFDTLARLSKAAREEYGLSGAVQHGASTLPETAFDKFPQCEASEVHLATGFQNVIYDNLPEDLREEAYAFCRKECADERKAGETEEQFLYKTRKKAIGPLKKDLWSLPADARQKICQKLEQSFQLIFGKLGIFNTTDVVQKFVKPAKIAKAHPAGRAAHAADTGDVGEGGE